MPASYVEVIVPYGYSAFRCPVCGVAAFTLDGFAPGSCRHVRLFVDWENEVTVPEPTTVPESWQATQAGLQALWDSPFHEDDVVATRLQATCDLLPASAVLFELREPGRGAGHEGNSCVVCIDFNDQDVPAHR